MEGSVLVVDDEEDVRILLARQLSRLGFECQTASDGTEGIEWIRRRNFDVTLTDLHMPGMDGISFLRMLEQENRDTVTVVLSGRTDIEKAVEAMKAGAFDVVQKHGDLNTLKGVVARAREHRRVKQHAKEMTELARQWQDTFDAVPDLIAVLDHARCFVRINRALAKLLNCHPDEAVGRPAEDWMKLADSGAAHCENTLERGNRCAYRAKVQDTILGRHYLVTTSTLCDAGGESMGSVLVARDITDQERTEEQLRTAHEETENLLASMYSFLIGIDDGGCVTRWNAMAEKTFGIAAQDALGRRFVQLPLDWDWDFIRLRLPSWFQAQSPVRLPELRYTTRQGAQGVLDITVNPVVDDDDDISGFFLLGMDITDRKNLESQLVHAQKLESIGQLAAGIAHEINTPTQYVGDNIRFLQTSFTDLGRLLSLYGKLFSWAKESGLANGFVNELEKAIRDADLEYLVDEIPKAIHESLDGVERVARIVRAMKEFSHPGAAEKTPIDLNRAIESTITVARNEWKYVADLETEFADDLPLVACLPGEFNQVILNMIINSAHAIEEVVGDGAAGKGRITVSTCRAGEWAEIRIADTGAGIPERARPKIFDPFFTTKEVGKGTGQGLAIAHNVIVEKHGGTLTFRTEMGKGTVFVVRLPINVSRPLDTGLEPHGA